MTHKAMIMAGGTGGHIFPALALAQGLQARGWQIVWLGTRSGLEARIVPEAGIPVEWLGVSGVRGKGWKGLVFGIPNLLKALVQAIKAIRKCRPDVVVGFGGFVAFPGGIAAALTGRTLLIHEQNAIAGLTNRVLSLFAKEVMTGFPDAFGQRGAHPLAKLLPIPRRATWTGNPVRSSLTQLPAPELRMSERSGPLKILVIGGSQGARILNQVVPEAIRQIPLAQRPLLTHQAGAKLLAEMANAYESRGISATVVPFIDDMAQALAETDLVICRAGALTVSEIAAVGVASILIPFPAAVDDHQTVNARFLSAAGAGILLPQSELTGEVLARLLLSLERNRLQWMAQLAKGLARIHATEDVMSTVMVYGTGGAR